MMTRLRAPWSSVEPSRRLRVIGILVLALGMIGAGLFYWIEVRSADPTLEELLPGYAHTQAREMRIMMGPFGVTLLE